MSKNAESVHNKALAARDLHHTLADKKLVDPSAITSDIFNKDLKLRFTKTYAMDALNKFVGKYVKVSGLRLPALLSAIGVGAIVGDRGFDLAEDSASGESHSCATDTKSISLCVSYEGLNSAAYKALETSCVNENSGVWMPNDYGCASRLGDYVPCDLNLNSVTVFFKRDTEGAPYDLICNDLSKQVQLTATQP